MAIMPEPTAAPLPAVPRASPAAPRKASPRASSARGPLALPVYRMLWIAQLVSNVATWMQTVAAQWFLTSAGAGPAVIALVTTFSALPVLLLALPAGVAADLIDRRRWLIGVQFGMAVVAGLLTVAAMTGVLTPTLLLVFVAAFGAGSALTIPAWQAVQPELVPRSMLPQAAALGGVNVNLARAVGPAIGGVIVALSGPAFVFGLNALSFLVIVAALQRWDRPRNEQNGHERLTEALRIGVAYARNAPTFRRVLLRVALFVVPGSAVWALLPVVAADQLGLEASGYGLLLGCLGIGAVIGAMLLRRVRARWSATGLLFVAALLMTVSTVIAGLSRTELVVAGGLLLGGAGWIWHLASLNAAAQIVLPAWVRARALSLYVLMLQGGQALGATLWGLLAQRWGVPASLTSAGVVMGLVALSLLHWGLRDATRVDPRPGIAFEEPPLLQGEDPGGGVLVIVEYVVHADSEEQFFEAMGRLRRVRRRTGALRWSLYRDAEQPGLWLEVFHVASWEDHVRQHARRTVTDLEVELVAESLGLEPSRTRHLVAPPSVVSAPNSGVWRNVRRRPEVN